jgi:phosphohistidine phosphatase
VDIFILRHGKAEDAGHNLTDAHRKLTKKGREEIAAVAEWMAAQGIKFDLIAASPLDRAQETAAIVADILGTPEKLETWKVLVPGGDPDTVCRETGKHPDDFAILLVGHEPLLSSLIGRIISGDAGAGIVMTKGALAKIRDFSCTEHPSGELHWLLMAKQMAGIRH